MKREIESLDRRARQARSAGEAHVHMIKEALGLVSRTWQWEMSLLPQLRTLAYDRSRSHACAEVS
jgi:hypothetical protein